MKINFIHVVLSIFDTINAKKNIVANYELSAQNLCSIHTFCSDNWRSGFVMLTAGEHPNIPVGFLHPIVFGFDILNFYGCRAGAAVSNNERYGMELLLYSAA